ncbi:beta-ketoacyl synthase N-terminal-like domain-containing protein [Streptomyces phaeofaciens]|uniref:beta-ketoacyl synthase N-terminal-like domain-containing protein n=1 Tax=Streptomyces phaeofaciens TaxID=68254 RepID=UPI00369056AC
MELADFYARLRLVVDFPALGADDEAAVSALFDRSVEFALNDMRWSADLADPAAGRRLVGVTVEDRFGRYGLSGVCVLRLRDAELLVDALTLNCRVLGKQVELHLLRHLARLAREQGADRLVLVHRRTARNAPMREFLDGLGVGTQAPEGPVVVPCDLVEQLPAYGEAVPAAASAPAGAARTGVSPRRDTELMDGIARTLTSGAQIAAAATRRSARTERPQTGTATAGNELERRIADIWQEILGLGSVGVEDGFFELGGHSLAMVRLYSRLCDELGRPDLTMVDLFRHPTIRRMAAFLAGEAAAPAAPAASVDEAAAPVASSDAVAVIGLACRTPGATSPEELWQALTEGRELLETFTAEEIAEAGADPRDPAVVPRLGWLADHDAFDAEFFGISPREAETTDPQQRVLLECAWSALEDAGRPPTRLPGTVGVFAGSGESDHLVRLLARPDLVASLGAAQLRLNNLKDYLAPRLAHRLGLDGPAINVQTACSSSLAAIHLARRALLAGDCDMAIAGGVSITTLEREGYRYEEGGIFSRDGHCRPFASDASGTVPGNGVGMVVLRRLEDALREGDPIRAVIRGSAVNNDGVVRAGFTAPGVLGQTAVIRRALADAGLRPDEVDVVEAHGTGTVLGDAIERAALTEVFRDRGRPLWIGSVKSNLGHMDTAAGVIGLIKSVMALEHAQLPASLHLTDTDTDGSADEVLRVNTELRSWPSADGRPRRAGVSSFGLGGTNAHVILEEPPAAPGPEPRDDRAEPLIVSAADPESLTASLERLRAWAERHPGTPVADVATTLRYGRKRLPYRASLACADLTALAQTAPQEWVRGGPQDRPVIFAFSGQGAQIAGAGAGLHAREAVFRDTVDEAAELLRPHLSLDIRDVLFDPTGAFFGQTRYVQPALFVLEYALAQFWRSRGIEPVAMIGHSVGEYTAATVSGVLCLEDAVQLVADRGRLMQEMPPGAMLAVALPEDEMPIRFPAELLEDLDVAAVNGPAQCVLAGPQDTVEELARLVREAGLPHRRLNTAHAFHSRATAPFARRFAERAARLAYGDPSVPYVSNVTGDWVAPRSVTSDYWARQLRGTVRFSAGVETLLARHPDAVFLEVGPGSSLSGAVRDHSPATPRLASLPRAADQAAEHRHLMGTLGALWCHGAGDDRHEEERGGRVVPLPAYPFRRRTFPVPRPWRASSSTPGPVGESAVTPRAAAPARPAPDRLKGLEPLMSLFWEELLGDGDLHSGSDFIALGGDSLVGMRLVARIADVLGVVLPTRTVFDAPSLAAQAGALEEAVRDQLGEDRVKELLDEARGLAPAGHHGGAE